MKNQINRHFPIFLITVFTLGREGRIITLEQQVNSLASKLEQALTYPSVRKNDTENAQQ